MTPNVPVQYRIPTQPWLGRSLVNHDPRSKAYRSMDLVPRGASVRDRSWRRGRVYDQGPTPHCVARAARWE